MAIQGAQAGLNALAASFYPTAVRSTGVGWALGVGRVGSIVGPLIGGTLLSMGWSPQRIFLAGMAPALCASIAILGSSLLRGQASAFRAGTGSMKAERENQEEWTRNKWIRNPQRNRRFGNCCRTG